MRILQTVARSLSTIDKSSWLGLCLLTAAVFIVSPLPVFAQSTPAQSAPASSPSAAPSQTQSNSQAQSQSQLQSQSQTSAQTDSSDKPDSLADEARKAGADPGWVR